MTRHCRWCASEATLNAYFDPDLWLCGPCAQRLAAALDAEGVWPEVDDPEDEIAGLIIPEVPLRYDGHQLEQLAELMAERGVRLHAELVEGHPVLSFTEPLTRWAADVAGAHAGLLVGAWAYQENKVIKLCGECRSPFLLGKQVKTICPVCAKGKRTLVLKIPFTERSEQRRAS